MYFCYFVYSMLLFVYCLHVCLLFTCLFIVYMFVYCLHVCLLFTCLFIVYTFICSLILSGEYRKDELLEAAKYAMSIKLLLLIFPIEHVHCSSVLQIVSGVVLYVSECEYVCVCVCVCV